MIYFCLKLFYQYCKSKSNFLGLQMERTGMDCILKKLGQFFSNLSLVILITCQNTDYGLFSIRKFTTYLPLGIL